MKQVIRKALAEAFAEGVYAVEASANYCGEEVIERIIKKYDI